MDGILNVNKPLKTTSQTAVTLVKRALDVRKAGHAGTLDPDATGVLLVCLGKATRLFDALQLRDKEYVGTVKLGVVTTTDDASGDVLLRRDVPELDSLAIQTVLERFRGEIEQVPPMVSALKHEGRRLYELARQGVVVERPPRCVTVYALELLETALPRLRLRVVCSRGTYVRSLARDIGEALGCGGHLESLERTRCGDFRVADAVHLRDVVAHPEEARRRVVSLSDAIRALG
jgi:tRNA pseudouridine55 synthase